MALTNKQIDRLLKWYCDDRAIAKQREIKNKERFMAEARRIVTEHAQERVRPETGTGRSQLLKLDH